MKKSKTKWPGTLPKQKVSPWLRDPSQDQSRDTDWFPPAPGAGKGRKWRRGESIPGPTNLARPSRPHAGDWFPPAPSAGGK
jgi:hypothetical protein